MSAIERELQTAMGLASCRGDEDKIEEAKEELRGLREELADAKKDASRYLWIRENNWGGRASSVIDYYGGSPEEMDKVIDAAISGK